jgi:uncharacterized protein (DUF433 family)
MGTVQTVQKSLRIPREIFDDIEKIASESGREFSAIAKDLLAEAVKMRRCPGIVFVNGVRGRKAKIAGTGLDVWEIIATYISVNNKFPRLRKAYHWLSDQQLKAAIGYYTAYRDEIDRLIEQNESWSSKTVVDHYPFLGPFLDQGDI